MIFYKTNVDNKAKVVQKMTFCRGLSRSNSYPIKTRVCVFTKLVAFLATFYSRLLPFIYSVILSLSSFGLFEYFVWQSKATERL